MVGIAEVRAPTARTAVLPDSSRRPSGIAAAVGAFGAVVAMAGSWNPSLWSDEVASLTSAQRSFPSLFEMLGHVDAVHGAYYVLLHFWVGTAGTSAFVLRLPSALAAGLAVAAVVLIVSKLSTIRLAVLAGLVCSVLPRMTSIGEDARSYALSAAVAAWLTYLLLVILERGFQPGGVAPQGPVQRRVAPRTLWILYGALMAAGILLFLYLALVAAAHLIVIWRAHRGASVFSAWGTATGCALLAAFPLAILAIGERAQIRYLSATPQVSARSLIVGLWFGDWPVAVISWVLIGIAIVAAIWSAGSSSRRMRVAGIAIPNRPSIEFIATSWLLVPSALMIGGQFLYPAFTARYLSFCAPAAAILIACGIGRIWRWRRPFGVLAIATFVGLVAPVYVAQRGPYAKNGADLAEISAAMKAEASPGDAVVFDRSVPISKKPRLALRAYPAGFAGLEDVTLKTPYYRNTSWLDVTYSIAQAAAIGRFDDVNNVWLIDYRSGDHRDRYGIADLQRLGYIERTIHVETPHSVIYEFSKHDQ